MTKRTETPKTADLKAPTPKNEPAAPRALKVKATKTKQPPVQPEPRLTVDQWIAGKPHTYRYGGFRHWANTTHKLARLAAAEWQAHYDAYQKLPA
jgi:hypothetical protein